MIEHAAGDLVVSVQAGARLGDLAEVLAAAGQRLALDPPSGPGGPGTVGGLIATGAAGPLRFRYGAPRDLLIGITVVRADGTVARSGGKVVKNVAGYDLGKLFAGSFGTLGLITEATFRLHPAPAAATWITLECPDPAAAADAVQVFAASPLAPAAIELHSASAADVISVSALLEGDPDSVETRAARMTDLLAGAATGQLSAQTKQADNRPGHPASYGTVLRIGFWAGQLASVLGAIRAAAARHEIDPVIGGSAAAGVLEVGIDDGAPVTGVASFVSTLRASLGGLAVQTEHPGLPPENASAVVVSAPADVRDAVDVWGPVASLALMRAIKDQFDPEHRMAPGRFAGGI